MRLRAETVHELLLQVWGEQACQVKPYDWPRVLKELMTKQGGGGEGSRGSYQPYVDHAVAAITAWDEVPDDPVAIWLAFPRFDPEHCIKFRELLRAEMRRLA